MCVEEKFFNEVFEEVEKDNEEFAAEEIAPSTQNLVKFYS